MALSVNSTSNGSLITEEMAQWLSHFNCSFQITLDGGKLTHDQTRFFKGGKPSYDIIVKNIKMLASKNIAVIARVNFTSKNIDSAEQIHTDFGDIDESSKKLISFDIQRVWQDRSNNYDKTEQKADCLRQKLHSSGFKSLSHNIS